VLIYTIIFTLKWFVLAVVAVRAMLLYKICKLL